jgi:hypothetical protein
MAAFPAVRVVVVDMRSRREGVVLRFACSSTSGARLRLPEKSDKYEMVRGMVKRTFCKAKKGLVQRVVSCVLQRTEDLSNLMTNQAVLTGAEGFDENWRKGLVASSSTSKSTNRVLPASDGPVYSML